MWKVPTEVLCNQHLLGEHCEMHMFIGCIENDISITGYIDKGLVEFHNIINRHDELAIEMLKRGMNHKSPLTGVITGDEIGYVDSEQNIKELKRRCIKCKERIEKCQINQNV